MAEVSFSTNGVYADKIAAASKYHTKVMEEKLEDVSKELKDINTGIENANNLTETAKNHLSLKLEVLGDYLYTMKENSAEIAKCEKERNKILDEHLRKIGTALIMIATGMIFVTMCLVYNSFV